MTRKLFPARKPRKPTQPKMLELFAEQHDWANDETEIRLSVPVRLVSEANQREHWSRRFKRKKEQQETMAFSLSRAGALLRTLNQPIALIGLCRVGRKMDADNNASSFKHVQDAIARFLGADDGDLEWSYSQVPSRSYEGRVGLRVRFMCSRQT